MERIAKDTLTHFVDSILDEELFDTDKDFDKTYFNRKPFIL